MDLKEFYRPLWGFGLVLIALILLANLVISRTVRSPADARPHGGGPAAAVPAAYPENVENSLSPDQPSRYDIVEQDEKDVPQDRGQWDYMIKKTFQDAGLEDRLKEDRQYRSLVTTYEEYQKRLAGVDSLIRINEEKLRADPGNATVRQQLEELNKLRSALLETEQYLVE